MYGERELKAIAEGAKIIPLTQGKFAIVDTEDFGFLSRKKWQAAYTASGFYATRAENRSGKRIFIAMHRSIMGNPDGLVIDHRNWDGLDNRKSNLRIATHGQNMHNRRRQRNNKSGFTGVYYETKSQSFCAELRVGGKYHRIRGYSTAESAALAYDVMSRKFHGDFGRPNFALPIGSI